MEANKFRFSLTGLWACEIIHGIDILALPLPERDYSLRRGELKLDSGKMLNFKV